jgi:hypothetical protein
MAAQTVRSPLPISLFLPRQLARRGGDVGGRERTCPSDEVALMTMPEPVVYKATADRISRLSFGSIFVAFHARIAEVFNMGRIDAPFLRAGIVDDLRGADFPQNPLWRSHPAGGASAPVSEVDEANPRAAHVCAECRRPAQSTAQGCPRPFVTALRSEGICQ